MWLKLETGMLLMLLLFKVLRKKREKKIMRNKWLCGPLAHEKEDRKEGQVRENQRWDEKRESRQWIWEDLYSQHFQRSQSSERPLLNAADIVFIQLPRNKNRNQHNDQFSCQIIIVQTSKRDFITVTVVFFIHCVHAMLCVCVYSQVF